MCNDEEKLLNIACKKDLFDQYLFIYFYTFRTWFLIKKLWIERGKTEYANFYENTWINKITGWSNYCRNPGWPSTNNAVEGGGFNELKVHFLDKKNLKFQNY